jgi:glycosyltransferase involved in cell wall biosynthesis
VQQLGLERQFIFTGLVPPADVPALIGVMDVLVHLSRREGLARALPQALAAAKPVIAYDCDGAREVCRDGETGFLLPVGDTQRLKSRLEQTCFDAPLCARLGTRGRELVQAQFPVQRMVDELHQLYGRLLAEQSAIR